MRADRLLSILLQLQAHGRLTARELAQRLEVSERTILRDMDALSSTGIPVVAERGAGGGWRLLDNYQTKLTGLSSSEIQALFLGRPPQAMADLGLRADSENALLKLQAALPQAARRRAAFARERLLIDPRGVRQPAQNPQALPALIDALWQERKIRFHYEAQTGSPGAREADPLGLVARGSRWRLVTQVDGGELRTYSVERISEVELLEDPSERPKDFQLAKYWERSLAEFRAKLPRYYATFLVEPGVLNWARYRGWRLEEETAEGDMIRIRLRFDVEEEALQFALSFGGRLTVLEPVELRAAVAAAAQSIVDLYKP